MGPSSGRVAAQTIPAAPAFTGRPPEPPISVATQPGHTELTRTRSRRSSAANIRVSALSDTLDTLYAGASLVMEASDPDSLETFTTRG